MPQIPQICPTPADLDLLELTRSGAYRPTAAHPLQLGSRLAGPCAEMVELVDPEGVPLTRLPVELNGDRPQLILRAKPRWTGSLSTRPFEGLYRRPADIRKLAEAGMRVILMDRQLVEADFRMLAGDLPAVLLVLAGPSTAPSTDTLDLLRCAQQLAALNPESLAVAVPIEPALAATDLHLYTTVLGAYAPHGLRRLPPNRAPSAPRHSGAVVFFTGLSGSGKSTVARALRNTILERYLRPVTLLDGDVVRRTLSAGLSFSPRDRETNVRRIGWVAAQIAHHGGIAICSPIAPYESTRQWVRDIVTQNGGQFVLIHVSTPLDECEQRDRKGLYAKARVGSIPDFTGVSAPYEEPLDADLVLDTSTVAVAESRQRVEQLLVERHLLTRP